MKLVLVKPHVLTGTFQVINLVIRAIFHIAFKVAVPYVAMMLKYSQCRLSSR